MLTPTTTLYIDGIPLPFAATAGAGANPGAVGAGATGTSTPLFCLPSGQCASIPGAWVGTSGQPVAEVIIAGTVLPIAPPGPQCVTLAAPANSCPAPY